MKHNMAKHMGIVLILSISFWINRRKCEQPWLAGIGVGAKKKYSEPNPAAEFRTSDFLVVKKGGEKPSQAKSREPVCGFLKIVSRNLTERGRKVKANKHTHRPSHRWLYCTTETKWSDKQSVIKNGGTHQGLVGTMCFCELAYQEKKKRLCWQKTGKRRQESNKRRAEGTSE